MENVTRALMIAFSMLIFVIAFSYSMYMINKLTTTSNTLLETVTTTNYYDNIKVSANNVTKRDVGIDTIIPTLYRYYKESYAVKILDENENLIQLFDLNIESKMGKVAEYTKKPNDSDFDEELYKLKNSIFNKTNPNGEPEHKAYLFGGPWTGNNEDAKTRIDFFLNGTKGYIKESLVDYSKTGPAFKGQDGGFIAYCQNSGTPKVFEESFVEYAYEGETISTIDDNGETRSRNDNRKYTRKFENYYNI